MTSQKSLILGINPGGGGNHLFMADATSGTIITQAKRRITDLPADVGAQFDPRNDDLTQWLGSLQTPINLNDVAVVVCRGPILRPDHNGLPDRFGIYEVNPCVIAAVEEGYVETRHGSEHAVVMGRTFAEQHGISAIFANPISGLVLPEHFRLTGHPNIADRRPLGHWLSAEGAMQQVYGEQWITKRIVFIHVGTGFTIAAFENGELVNVNDANSGGSGFSDTRGQGMPFEQSLDYFIKSIMALNGPPTNKLLLELVRDIKTLHQTGCGLAGLVGVKNLEGLIELLNQKDQRAIVVYDAMVEGLGEEIAARLANLQFDVDSVIITGGMANSSRFLEDVYNIIEKVVPDDRWHVLPGSCEIKVMISAAQRYLGGEKPLQYSGIPA